MTSRPTSAAAFEAGLFELQKKGGQRPRRLARNLLGQERPPSRAALRRRAQPPRGHVQVAESGPGANRPLDSPGEACDRAVNGLGGKEKGTHLLPGTKTGG